MTVTALAGTPLHVLNAALERLGLSLHNMGDIAEQTLAGAISTGTHGTGGVAAGAGRAGRRARAGHRRPASVLHADADRERRRPRAVARVGLGALGILTTVTFRGRAALPARGARAADVAGTRRSASLRRAGRGEPPRRHVLVPAHRPDADQAQQPHDVDAARAARPAGAPGSTTSSSPTRVFGWAQPPSATARPALIPRMNRGRRPGAQPAHLLSDVAAPGLHLAAAGGLPRDGVRRAARGRPRRAPRGAARSIERRDWRISFPVEIRVAPADDVPLSTAYGRDSFYLAFHTNRARPTTRRTSAAIEHVLRGARRPPALGQAAHPHRRRPRAGVPALGTSSRRCATGSTPTGSSPTTTCGACWGARAGALFHPSGPLCNSGVRVQIALVLPPPRAIVPRPGPALSTVARILPTLEGTS